MGTTAQTNPRHVDVQTAVVFPGQGAQRRGMAKDLYQGFCVAKRTFEEVSDAIGLDVAKICFEDDSKLNHTSVTQPCLLTAESAAYRVAVEEFGLDARFFGGHSLGEYTALVAADVLPLAEAAKLVRARGEFMQEASLSEGGMAALILDSIETSGAEAIVAALGAEVANRNSPSQIAISGTLDALNQVRKALQEAVPELEFVALKVSAPFHSRFMRPVVPRLLERLEACRHAFRAAAASRVTSNLTGQFHEPERLLTNLANQVAAPVRWRDNMAVLGERAERILELGPRGSLSKFFSAAGLRSTALTSAADLEAHMSRGAGAAERGRTTATAKVACEGPRLSPAQYVIGGMGRGIGSARLVTRAARAGFLAFLGTSGLTESAIEREVLAVRSAVPAGAPWGLNITMDHRKPAWSAHLVDIAIRYEVPSLELAGFRRPDAALVRARLSGMRREPDGRLRLARRILAKVSDEETAQRLLAPPPPNLVAELIAAGTLDPDAASAARRLATVDDLCAAPGWGEDPTFPASMLLPVLSRLTRAQALSQASTERVRVGLAGGLGSPESIGAAFAAGADFVLTGSVNQCTVEAAVADEAKTLLAAANIDDFGLAPDVDRFELGGRVQVLRRGLGFVARADGVEQLWRRYGSLAAMPVDGRNRIEALCRKGGDPSEATSAESPSATVALIRCWLEGTLRRAIAVEADAVEDLQIQSGPAIAAFNRCVQGSPLADWTSRHVDDVARFLLDGAFQLLTHPTWA